MLGRESIINIFHPVLTLPSVLATSGTVYKEGYELLSECWSPAKMARVALALAHSHCHLCSSHSHSDCKALAHCLTEEEQQKISRAYLSVNPEHLQGGNSKQ